MSGAAYSSGADAQLLPLQRKARSRNKYQEFKQYHQPLELLSSYFRVAFSTMYAVFSPLNVAKMSNGHSGYQAPTTYTTNGVTNGTNNGHDIHTISDLDGNTGNTKEPDCRNSCKATDVDEISYLCSRYLPALPNTVRKLRIRSVQELKLTSGTT